MLTDAALLLAESREREAAGEGGSNLLAACSVVLTAAGLEQVLEETLMNAQATHQLEQDERSPQLDKAAGESFRWKLINVPRIACNGELEVNRKHPRLPLLHRLIDVRNRLVHRRDQVHLMRFSDPETEEGEEQAKGDESETPAREVARSGGVSITLTSDGDAVIKAPVPTSPWRAIGTAEAENYLQATKEYLREWYLGQPVPPGETSFVVSTKEEKRPDGRGE